MTTFDRASAARVSPEGPHDGSGLEDSSTSLGALLERQLEAYARDLRELLDANRRYSADLNEAHLDTFRLLLSGDVLLSRGDR